MDMHTRHFLITSDYVAVVSGVVFLSSDSTSIKYADIHLVTSCVVVALNAKQE